MKAIHSTIIILCFAAVLHAEKRPSLQIIEALDIKSALIPPVQGKENINLREQYSQRLVELMADNLEQNMTPEHLHATLEFVSSPAGKAFFKTINDREEMMEGSREIMNEFNSKIKNQSD